MMMPSAARNASSIHDTVASLYGYENRRQQYMCFNLLEKCYYHPHLIQGLLYIEIIITERKSCDYLFISGTRKPR
jgi:hypothetical protein